MKASVNSWPANLQSRQDQYHNNSEVGLLDRQEESLLSQNYSLLQSLIDKLETEKDSLTYTISDLKQLIQRLAVESDRDAERRRRITQEMESKIKKLEKAAEIARYHSGHLKIVQQYWDIFLN